MITPEERLDEMIPLSSVSVTQAERGEVWNAVASGNVSGTGAAVKALEDLYRADTGCEHAVATNSGTSALELALEVLNIGPGDEVLVPSFTFAAPASAVINRGADPVLCDVDAGTWTLDAASCVRMISRRTKAVIAVDVMGNPCDYAALSRLGLPIIEDAAEAVGAHYLGRVCGSMGIVSVLSFHANKTVAAGEGGMLLTDDGSLAHEARLRVNHGMSAGYLHSVPGHNFRMGNLSASFALAQSKRARELLDRRREVQSAYRSGLQSYPLETQVVTSGASASVWLVCFRTRERDALVDHLRSNGVDARAVWPSLSEQPFLEGSRYESHVSRLLSRECFWLPTFHDLTANQIQHVIAAVQSFFHARAV